MANCPKFGKHLHVYNVSQYCPGCGVNINFYGYAERFTKEAKMSELSMANVHVKIRRIKAAYIGSKLAIKFLSEGGGVRFTDAEPNFTVRPTWWFSEKGNMPSSVQFRSSVLPVINKILRTLNIFNGVNFK